MKNGGVKSLSELVDEGAVQLTRGKVISKKDIAAHPGNYPVYSSAKEGDGKFGEYGSYMFDEELITWSVDGGGRLFHRPKHKFSVTNVGGVLRILDQKLLDYRYLYYALTLRHSVITFDWVKKAHPSIIKKLYTDIPILPLPEQQRIVGILDEAFAGLATATANAEKNLQNARALFESELECIFSKRGVGWVEKRLEQIGTTQTGSTPRTSDRENYGDFIPFVKPADFNVDGSIDYQKDGLSKKGLDVSHKVEKNSVLMVCIGATIGKCGFCDREVTTNQQINALTPNGDCSHKFIYYRLLTADFQHRVRLNAGQATLPIISKSKWSALTIWLPSKKSEQHAIAEKLDDLLEESQRLADIYERKLAALAALKKSLLHHAFTGQL